MDEESVVRKNSDLSGASAASFYSRENIAELERRVVNVRLGKNTLKEHELIEVEE